MTREDVVRESWAAWTENCALIVAKQVRRVQEEPDFGEREPDLLILVDAPHKVLVGATRVLGPDHAAIAEFDRTMPDAKDMRDMFAHFDEYLAGTGNLQGKGKADGRIPWWLMFSSMMNEGVMEHRIVILTKTWPDLEQRSYTIEASAADAAARRLALATLEAVGNTEVSEPVDEAGQ